MARNADIHVLRDWQQVRALADPIRMKILQELGKTPMTTMEISRLTGEKTTRLYHHMEALELAGLIELAETRQKRGCIEKVYRAIASDFQIDRHLLEVTDRGGQEGKEGEDLFISALRATVTEATESVERGLIDSSEGRGAAMYRMRFRGSPVQMQALREQIDEFITRLSTGESGEVEYSLAVAFYPTLVATEPYAAKNGTASEEVGK